MNWIASGIISFVKAVKKIQKYPAGDRYTAMKDSIFAEFASADLIEMNY